MVRDHLSPEALGIIRYHSFYAAHQARAYDFLMNDEDHRIFEHVRDFNRYDLYSKTTISHATWQQSPGVLL